MVTITNQIQSDKRLLQFEAYEDYLDSLVTPTDLCYLRSTWTARAIAELGYRNSGETLSREQFIKRRNDVVVALSPCFTNKPCSPNIRIEDPFLQELAMRERANRVGLLATIIFVRQFTKAGDEVSGYIDYGDRLKNENWVPLFEGKKRLWPRHTDLGFYHWKIGKSYCNSSENYKIYWIFMKYPDTHFPNQVPEDTSSSIHFKSFTIALMSQLLCLIPFCAFICKQSARYTFLGLPAKTTAILDPNRGLLFQNRNDRKVVCVDPDQASPGSNTNRIRIYTPKYPHIVLYDHLVRRKC